MNWKSIHVALCASAFFALSASPVYAGNVNCNSSSSNLQAKISSANVGDTIDITGECKDGPYFIKANIRLVGDDKETTTLSAPSDGFAVINVEKSAHVTLKKLTIDGTNRPIRVFVEGGTARLERVVIQNATGEGLRLSGSSFALIQDNTLISGNGLGMLVIASSSFRMHNTTIASNGSHGILMFGSSSGALFSGNLIDNNGGDGITINSSGSFQMSGTTISNNDHNGVTTTFYSFINLFNPPNTIEYNANHDVACLERGGLHVSSPQLSATKTKFIGDCVKHGTIF